MTSNTSNWISYTEDSDTKAGKVSSVRICAILDFDQPCELESTNGYELLENWRHYRHYCEGDDSAELRQAWVQSYKPWIELKRITITMPAGEPYTSTDEDERTYRQVCDSDDRKPTNSGFARWLLDQRCSIQIQYQSREQD